MSNFNLRHTILLLLPALVLAQGCGKKKDTKKKKTNKKAQIEARSAMPECKGQIDACGKLFENCKDDDIKCEAKASECFDKIPENCFPALPDNMEDTPDGWVDFFEVCFKDPRLDECFKTYNSCIDKGTDEQKCFEAMDKCIQPLVTSECKKATEGELPGEGQKDDKKTGK